uniref:Protein kinase domain-containing protein n=1 Tax=Schizophyllum commune (strain H4-8 / FGSC 9210) TaxID=578458 RepID=D8PSF8_SCHCM
MPPEKDDWTQPRLDSDGPDDKIWQGWEPVLARYGYALTTWPFRLLIKNKHRQGKRTSDGAFVVIKFVLWRKYRTEVDVVRRLLSGKMRLPELNRFPYLDVIDVPMEEEGGASLVISEVCAEEDAWWDLKNPRDILRGVCQLAECVHFLHENGIAHCDIWHPNVVIRLPLQRPLRWVLIDFNSAVVAEEGTPPPTITPLHHTGSRLEAPEFYAPFWTQIDPFAYDVFCLCHLMEILMEGSLQHVDLPRYSLIVSQDKEIPIPPGLRTLVNEMIDEDPSSRPSSASMLERLHIEVEALDQGEDPGPGDAHSNMLAHSQRARAKPNAAPHSLLTYLHEHKKYDQAVYILADDAHASVPIPALEPAAALNCVQ